MTVQVVEAVFDAGASVSRGVALVGHIVSVSVPAGWGANLMTFDGSHDPDSILDGSATWWPLLDELLGTELTRAVAEGRGMPLNPVSISGFRRFRLRRGLLASPQAWTAGGTVLLGTRGYA